MRKIALITSLAAALPVLSNTQSRAATDILEEIQVTATRRVQPNFEVAPAVTIVDAQELRRNTPLTIVDHLRGEPGTFVQQTTPGQGIVIVRGLKGSEVLHLVDGFRLNNTIFRNAPNQYVALLDPWNLERVEVVRGPMSALHGGDAMGGVVQFVTRVPSFSQAEVASRAKLGMQLASANESVALSGEGEVGNERWLVHGGGTWQDVNEVRTGNGETLPHTAFSFRAVNGRVQFQPRGDQQLQLQVQWSEQPQTQRYDALVPGFGQSRPDFVEHFFEPQQRAFGQLRGSTGLQLAFADELEVQVGYQQIVDNRRTRDFGSSLLETEENKSDLWGASALLTRAISAEHTLVYGLESYRDRVTSSRTRRDLATDTATMRPSRFPNGSSQRWVAAFAQDTWTATPALDLTGAARYSDYVIELAATQTDIGVRLQPDDWSWNFGALYRASEQWHWTANVGKGFRPPNIFDLGTFGARQNRFSIPNPGLQPENVLTYDIGFKVLEDRWVVELSAFQSRYEDKITQVLTGAVDDAGRLIVQSQNATELRLQGVEAGVLYRPVDPVQIYLTATWSVGDEELDGARYPADRVPPLFGKLDVQYLVRADWDVSLRVDWAAEQDRLSPRDEVDPRIDPAGTDDWLTVSLDTQVRVWRPLTLSMGLENLFDAYYREHGSGFESPGRSLTLRAEWQL